jgi:hypothetical protein
VRLNFVDHGKNFAKGENGMEKLTDKVKQIYDTYANENIYFDRIALVGCDTSRIRQGLTRNFIIIPLINHFFTTCFHGFSAIRVDLHVLSK